MRALVNDAKRNHNETVFSCNNYSQKFKRLTLGPLLLLNYIIICELLLPRYAKGSLYLQFPTAILRKAELSGFFVNY